MIKTVVMLLMTFWTMEVKTMVILETIETIEMTTKEAVKRAMMRLK